MKQMGESNFEGMLQMGTNARELNARFKPVVQPGSEDISVPQQKPERPDYEVSRLQQQMQQVQM
jgi:hypothetical protein